MASQHMEIMYLQEPEELQAMEDHPKTLRCYFFASNDIPRSYFENSSKEELCLEHVLEYQRQFKIIYDPLRDLLLAPKNECGKRKFICSTLRPTKLPYPELYDFVGCAKFVADYLEYEELVEPNKLPELLPSPANVLDWQAGDCFDFAIVLCSLLLGTGYDAYVVYGTAPKDITTKDQSLMDCPFDLHFDDQMDDEDPHIDKDDQNMHMRKDNQDNQVQDFKVEIKEPHKSVFDDQSQLDKLQAAHEAKMKAVTIDDDEADYEPDDEYGRSRIHAWVMIRKGDREMKESIFIEPTTGRQYSLDNSPYHTIQAIFNNKNFWVNLDHTKEITQMNLEEFIDDPTGEWEYVMIQKKVKSEENQDDEANGESSEEAEDDGQSLDMPPPWSPKLIVDKDKFTDGCPKGERTVFYKKCRVDFFSECKQVDGLVKRITIYKDYKRLITQEIRSYYKCRKDKLAVRRRFPYEFKLIEHYESSDKTFHWKKLIQIDGVSRKLYFYHHRNKDGLIYREEQIGRKTFEYYKGREDRLIYRSVTFDPSAKKDNQSLILKENHTGQEVVLNKMTQRFELDPNLSAESQIKKTEFNLDKKMIYIYYHYKEGKITADYKDFHRDDLIGSAKTGDMNEKDVEETQLQQTQKKIIDMENICHQEIKEYERTAFSETQIRVENEKAIHQLRATPNAEETFAKILEKSVFAKARDKMKNVKKKDEEETNDQKEKDFLAPILKKLSLPQDNTALEEEAAIAVKNEALRSLKERLLTRAEIIQRRLEEEQTNLSSKFQEFKRKGESFGSNDQANYQKEVAKANFRMDILTERAAQHYRNSLEKFQDLDQKLQDDPRLKVLQAKKQ